MKDALENLRKLPPRSLAVIEGKTMMIARGGEATPYPLVGTDAVERWNAKHGVTKAQAWAMTVGLMHGWDADGADPEEHGDTFDDDPALRSYRVTGTLLCEMNIEAASEDDAADQMFSILAAIRDAHHAEGFTKILVDTIDADPI